MSHQLHQASVKRRRQQQSRGQINNQFPQNHPSSIESQQPVSSSVHYDQQQREQPQWHLHHPISMQYNGQHQQQQQMSANATNIEQDYAKSTINIDNNPFISSFNQQTSEQLRPTLHSTTTPQTYAPSQAYCNQQHLQWLSHVNAQAQQYNQQFPPSFPHGVFMPGYVPHGIHPFMQPVYPHGFSYAQRPAVHSNFNDPHRSSTNINGINSQHYLPQLHYTRTEIAVASQSNPSASATSNTVSHASSRMHTSQGRTPIPASTVSTNLRSSTTNATTHTSNISVYPAAESSIQSLRQTTNSTTSVSQPTTVSSNIAHFSNNTSRLKTKPKAASKAIPKERKSTKRTISGVTSSDSNNKPSAKVNQITEKEGECCICLEIPSDKEKAIINSCSHQFCWTCIEMWSEKENTCKEIKSTKKYLSLKNKLNFYKSLRSTM